MPGNVAGRFSTTPLGVILHGSRSGAASNDVEREYTGTVNFVRNGAGGLGWSATIGHHKLALHMGFDEYGWNAREHSSEFLAVEFAQAVEAHEITDGQVAAFAWFFHEARKVWPRLPLNLPTHAELPAGIRDGKTDPYSRGSPKADELRARILSAIGPFETAPSAPGPLSQAPNQQFTLDQLWPEFARSGDQYGFDPQVLAAVCYQESGWRNWRVHRDGTGHGLFGLDDNGLLPDFEAWSGIAVGRGQAAISIPPEQQIEYAAYQLRRYQDAYGDPIMAAQAWHRGGRNREDERGQHYGTLIRAHVRSLFG